MSARHDAALALDNLRKDKASTGLEGYSVTEKNTAQIVDASASDAALVGIRDAALALINGELVRDPAILADLLQRATERLNPLIERAEKALAALKLNVPASITLEFDPENGWGRYLHFRKVGREWGLYVEAGRDCDDDESWEITPLHSASRDVRLRALSGLPELEQALADEAAKQCADALRVVANTSTYLSALEARKP